MVRPRSPMRLMSFADSFSSQTPLSWTWRTVREPKRTRTAKYDALLNLVT